MGDITCDVYLWGTVSRISPEAPVPVFESTERRTVLGGAANVAANLQALGCEVCLLGVVGVDAAAQEVRMLLDKQGIAATWLLEDASRLTTEKTRLIAHQQHMLRLDHEQRLPLDATLQAQVCDYARALLAEVDGVVCSDYNKGVCTPEMTHPVFAQARATGHSIIVRPQGPGSYALPWGNAYDAEPGGRRVS
jgi:D-beta-D-heptose 7-phosphate kinase/D-beta-D-heptose 1-phosphate adenosyltransferase